MRSLTLGVLVAGIVAGATAGTANAVNCYIVFDRNNAVVYQDAIPPVDMSERGDATRAAMRNRGQFLMVMDAAQCPRRIVAAGPAGAPATVDEIVSEMRAYPGASGTVASSVRSVGAPPATSR